MRLLYHAAIASVVLLLVDVVNVDAALFASGDCFKNDIEATLQQEASFDFDEVQFLDVMNWLSDKYDINVVIDRSAIDDSLSAEEYITFQTKSMRLSTALRLMLKEKNATFVIRHNVLIVISMDVQSDPEYFQRKIIDCQQLIERIKTLEHARIGTTRSVTRLNSMLEGEKVANADMLRTGLLTKFVCGGGRQAIQPAGAANESPGKSVPGAGSSSPQELSAARPVARNGEAATKLGQADRLLVTEITAESILIDLVKNLVDRDGWEDSNGDGVAMVVGGNLIVLQSQQVLDEIEDLLNELGEKLGGSK